MQKGIACYRSADTVPTTDQWAVTPEIDLGGELSFYMRNYYIGHHENFEVYLSTSGNSLNDFINDGVMLLSGSTEDVLTRYTYDLSDYEGLQGYIAFRYTGGYKVILLDDVALIKEPAGSWTVEEQVTSPYAISGLTPKTQYDMQVQGIYGENKTTEWCDIVKFTTTEDFTTLAEALAGDNGDIVIEDKLSVVVANDNYAIVSDGKGNWLKVVGNNTIGNYAGVSMLDGILSNVELNPVFDVLRFVPSDEVVDVELKHLDLRTIHRTALTELKPNEVADFMGYYNAETGELCAFSPNTEYGGLHIAMTTDNMVGAISTGKQQKFTGVVSLKEAWDAPSGAPARVALDDDLAFENIQIDATAASVATGVETVKMFDGKEIEGIYNVNGQRVTRADKGVYIIRFQDGTTQKVRF